MTRKSKKYKQEMKAEIKLAISGVIFSTLYVSIVLCYIMWSLGSTWIIWDFVFLFAADLFSASNPYLLLLFSSLCPLKMLSKTVQNLLFSAKLRKYFVRVVTCGKVGHLKNSIKVIKVGKILNKDAF